MSSIAETALAIPLYWYIGLKFGFVLSLFVSAAIAPLVLLRSERSIESGLRSAERLLSYTRFDGRYEINRFDLFVFIYPIALLSLFATALICSLIYVKLSISVAIPCIFLALWIFPQIIFCLIFIFIGKIKVLHRIIDDANGVFTAFLAPIIIIGAPLSVFLLILVIRINATLMHLSDGFKALPQNFRLLTLCTSPIQIPEILPGIENSKDLPWSVNRIWAMSVGESTFFKSALMISYAILFFPGWIYRLSIKSTSWFWWPLAFLGGDIGAKINAPLMHWNIVGSLWAKSNLIISTFSITSFIIVNFIIRDNIFVDKNPLLTPIGYLLLINWNIKIWQISALTSSLLSIVLVFISNDVAGKTKIGLDSNDLELIRKSKKELTFIYILMRARILLVVMFWTLTAFHAGLYFNSRECWLNVPPMFHDWIRALYGSQTPIFHCIYLNKDVSIAT